MLTGRVFFSAALVCLVVVWGIGGGPAAVAAGPDTGKGDLAASGWIWPVDAFRVTRAYVAPAHSYGPGHRGIDLEPPAATVVRAPAPGIVAFSGAVAGRGIVTIDHGNGLVTTLEPVESELRAGGAVARGDPVGTISAGGHTPAGSVHFGVRLHDEYVNPLRLLGGVPRAVLLPCCG